MLRFFRLTPFYPACLFTQSLPKKPGKPFIKIYDNQSFTPDNPALQYANTIIVYIYRKKLIEIK
jgi:hypothetical protein